MLLWSVVFATESSCSVWRAMIRSLLSEREAGNACLCEQPPELLQRKSLATSDCYDEDVRAVDDVR